MSPVGLIVVSVAIAAGCVTIGRAIVWALEWRQLTDVADRRRVTILMAMLVFLWVVVFAFEATPH